MMKLFFLLSYLTLKFWGKKNVPINKYDVNLIIQTNDLKNIFITK